MNITDPDHANEWHPTKNGDLQASDVSRGSTVKVWWLGSACGHTFYSTPGNKVNSKGKNRGCGVCTGNQVQIGVNDLQSKFPLIASEWHPTKNEHVTPINVPYSSNKIRWWLGSGCGHVWDMTVNARTQQGQGCPYCAGKRVLLGFNDLTHCSPKISAEWAYDLNSDVPINKITRASGEKVWWRCAQFDDHVWQSTVSDRAGGHGCPICSTRNSVPESELYEFLATVYKGKILRSAAILNRKEVDIYIPELKIGVEFNGIYWHSEKFKTSTDHLNKRLAAEAQGIRLITIWEDDWRDKRLIVESMLKSKLGVDEREKVYARNTTITEIDYSSASDFLNSYHIQGSAKGSIYIGSVYEGELVAVMVLAKRNNGEYELSRYATSKHVIGGQSKMLSWVKKNTAIPKLVTFADLDISDGNLYTKTGWSFIEELAPDYKYSKLGSVPKREHKFNYRLKRFKSDPTLKYEEGLTEKELAKLNKLYRIWDSGKKKYELTFTS